VRKIGQNAENSSQRSKRPQEVAARVRRPVRDAGEREVEPRGDLSLECRPVARDVARPRDRAVALLTGVGRAGQDEHALVARGGALPVVDGGRRHERECVVDGGARARAGLSGAKLAPASVELRLGRVEPPSVDALGEQRRVHLLPVQRARVRLEGVVVHRASVGQRGRHEVAGGLERRVVRAPRREARPHGDHRVEARVVERLEHPRRVRIARVELMRAPRVRAPVRPVLHDVVDRDLHRAVGGRDAQQLVLRAVVVLALPVPVGPAAEERRRARERAVGRDDVVGAAGHEVVVDEARGLGRHRDAAREVDGRHRRVVPEEAVAAARDEDGHAALARVLLQELNGAGVGHLAALRLLMLAETVEVLARVG
jgi:hypothetical protein